MVSSGGSSSTMTSLLNHEVWAGQNVQETQSSLHSSHRRQQPPSSSSSQTHPILIDHPPSSMSSPILYLILITSSLFIPSHSHTHTHTHLQNSSTDQSFASLLISQNGLDFLKDLLLTKSISSIAPLQLPQIQQSIRIPFLGGVHVVLSNITIYKVDVPSSIAKLGDTGVTIVGSGATCNLSMNWHYSYGSWLVPISISDSGHASVQVEGMEIGLTLGVENHEGSLKVSLLESGCHVKDISISLDGGASWFYQGLVDAFEEQIGSAVENAIAKKLTEGVTKLDLFLQGLPKEIPVDDAASLNVTFVNDPVLSDSSLGFAIDGLFVNAKKEALSYSNTLQPSVGCTDPSKMLGITLDEAVFNSASALYFNANFMRWIVDEVPNQSLLNTAGWRFIIPQLYKKYPNADMNLNISLPSPPVIRISQDNIDATVYTDLVIDVLEAGDTIPVACISLVIRALGSVEVSGNNLAGNVKLNDFTMSLEWSKVGNLRMYLIQPVIWTVIETVFLPHANARLGKGFPLPIIHGFTLEGAEIILSSSRITVCSDVSFREESIDLRRSLVNLRFMD